MNHERRAALLELYVTMAIACVRVAPLAQFYVAKARSLIPPPSVPPSIATGASVGGQTGGGPS